MEKSSLSIFFAALSRILMPYLCDLPDAPDRAERAMEAAKPPLRDAMLPVLDSPRMLPPPAKDAP